MYHRNFFQNELLALFREEITRDINDVNKTWTKKVKSTSEGHFRDREVIYKKEEHQMKSIPQNCLNQY